MKRNLILVLIAVVLVGAVAAAVWVITHRQDDWVGGVLAVGVDVPTTLDPDRHASTLALAAAAGGAEGLAGVTIDYPMNESIFPPKIIAPTFLWQEPNDQSDRWLIDVALGDGSKHVYALTDGPPAPTGEIDVNCLAANNEPYELTPYQAAAKSWTPDDAVWEAIKAASVDAPATITVVGYNAERPDQPLSRGQMTLTTSSDPVDGVIFYRDVPLMPTENEKGNIKPLPDDAIRLVTWRLRDISRKDTRAVLTNIPTCANCHSFSRDGSTMAMDIDGPSGDKGAYALADIEETTVITTDDIITWNAYEPKAAGHKTIGFMSRVSPDGRYAISTVNEAIYSAGFKDYRFLQVFFPTRGILAYYNRETAKFLPLPGADNPDFVQCDPVWGPDGEWIVFARAEARDPYIEGRDDPEYANHMNETPMQYDLYRIPFNGGRGGTPEPIEGASANGMSNTFPKISPDRKWVVFVKCRNGQLQRPDSRLWIVPFEGGEAREMNCNMSVMNSWHSFSPNGRWMVFSSKHNTPYTQMFLTYIDEDGNDSPAILIPHSTAANRAVNLPEFVNIDYDDLQAIEVPTVEYYRHYERGNNLHEAGRYVEAAEEFRKALAAEPTSTRINNSLGMCLIRTGEIDEAIACFRTALDLFPDDPRMTTLYCNLGLALSVKGLTDEAIEQYHTALAMDPRNVLAHMNMAEALASQGKIDEAITWCNDALAIEPSARAHIIVGRLIYSQAHRADGSVSREQLTEAIEHWRLAVEINPEYITAYTNMGAALAELGQQDRAMELYRQALGLDPKHVPALMNLTIALARQAQSEEGLARQGLNEEALELALRALALQPDDVFLLVHTGTLMGKLGNVDAAIVYLERALEIDPDNAAALTNLQIAQNRRDMNRRGGR